MQQNLDGIKKREMTERDEAILKQFVVITILWRWVEKGVEALYIS
jgi:hypothetical protein